MSLPFHAADDHFPASTENTFSRVASSYTPTLEALVYSQEAAKRTASRSTDHAHVLTVAMPTTPGQADLPGVAEEISQITRLFQDKFLIQSLTSACCCAVRIRRHLRSCFL